MTAVLSRRLSSRAGEFKGNVTKVQELFLRCIRDEKPRRVDRSGGVGFSQEICLQPRRLSENWAPLSWVQFSCLGVTSEQLTRDWVLRTSDVMLISTSVGERLV